ncbi:unnamed protein product [Ascophyllum nodosum]
MPSATYYPNARPTPLTRPSLAFDSSASESKLQYPSACCAIANRSGNMRGITSLCIFSLGAIAALSQVSHTSHLQ